VPIIRSALRCAAACGGNKARETPRSVPWLAMRDGTLRHRNREPSASKLASASLHISDVTNPPEMVKSATRGEITVPSAHETRRGDWRGRAMKEQGRSREIRPSVGGAGCPFCKVNGESITRVALESEVGAVRSSREAGVMSVEQRDRTDHMFVLNDRRSA
jgi:hypothetical protein